MIQKRNDNRRPSWLPNQYHRHQLWNPAELPIRIDPPCCPFLSYRNGIVVRQRKQHKARLPNALQQLRWRIRAVRDSGMHMQINFLHHIHCPFSLFPCFQIRIQPSIFPASSASIELLSASCVSVTSIILDFAQCVYKKSIDGTAHA